MDPKIKAQWIADLKSGQYKQGRGSLNNWKGEFCCLGVLCEQAVKEGAAKCAASRTWPKRAANHKFPSLYDGNPNYLSDGIMKWSGLASLDGAIEGIVERLGGSNCRVHPTLASMNDAGLTFSQLADMIEYFF